MAYSNYHQLSGSTPAQMAQECLCIRCNVLTYYGKKED
jgi:hypothetical protein